MRKMILMLAVFNFGHFAEASYNNGGQNEQSYKNQEQIENSQSDMGKNYEIRYPSTAKLEKYREKFEETKNKAISEPTQQNILKYKEMQKEVFEVADEFAQEWANNGQKTSSSASSQNTSVEQ